MVLAQLTARVQTGMETYIPQRNPLLVLCTQDLRGVPLHAPRTLQSGACSQCIGMILRILESVSICPLLCRGVESAAGGSSALAYLPLALA